MARTSRVSESVSTKDVSIRHICYTVRLQDGWRAEIRTCRISREAVGFGSSSFRTREISLFRVTTEPLSFGLSHAKRKTLIYEPCSPILIGTSTVKWLRGSSGRIGTRNRGFELRRLCSAFRTDERLPLLRQSSSFRWLRPRGTSETSSQ